MHEHALDEYEKLGNVIRAAEDWSSDYEKSPDTFAKLLKAEGKLERNLIGYFTGLAERAPGYVNWFMYTHQVKADDDFRVDVLITDELRGYEDGLFVQAAYDPIETAVHLGSQAGDDIYKIPLGITKSSKAVQDAAADQIAFLVGKKVDKFGNIVDNPNAKYSITDQTRKDIRQSIRTSLNLGENQEAATARLRNAIKDPKRASKIAATESVNAYQGGLYAYAKGSGAVGKEWQTILGACPICQGNASAGPIGINDTFPSGDKAPAAHPWDRCSLRFIYPEEAAAKKITSPRGSGFDATDLETIAQTDIAGRPNAEINTAIEKLLNSDAPAAVRDSIGLALQLPPTDAVAMLNSITYKGKSVVDQFYVTKFDVATKKITKVLKDASKDPLKMSVTEIAKAAGIPEK